MRLRRSQTSTGSETNAVLGRRITEARLEAGLTKTQLADKLGVPVELCEQYESGEVEPSAQRLGELVKITGRPADWFRGAGTPPAPAAGPEPAAPAEEPEPAAEAVEPEESEPDLAHTEEEHMAEESEFKFAAADDPVEDEPAAADTAPTPAMPAAAAAAAGEPDDEFSEDDLARVLTGLSRQRDSLATRRSELDSREAALDSREAALSEREDHIGAREDALTEQEAAAQSSSRFAELDEEWQEKLTAFEDTNRQYASATTALAEWAAELRGDAPADDDEPEASAEAEPEASAAADAEPDELASSTAVTRDHDDFPEEDF